MSDTTPLCDSGERRETSTGAVRDRATGKGRFDLLPVDALFMLAEHFEKGAAKYAERNWEQGMPLSWYLDSGIRHALKELRGDTDEPHGVAAAWNFLCFLQTREWIRQGVLPSRLDDLPRRIPSYCTRLPDGLEQGCPVCQKEASEDFPEEGCMGDEVPEGTEVGSDDAVATTAYAAAAKKVYGKYLDEDFADETDPSPDEDPLIVPGYFRIFAGTHPDRVYFWDGISCVEWTNDYGVLDEAPYVQDEARNNFRLGRWVRCCEDGSSIPLGQL